MSDPERETPVVYVSPRVSSDGSVALAVDPAALDRSDFTVLWINSAALWENGKGPSGPFPFSVSVKKKLSRVLFFTVSPQLNG